MRIILVLFMAVRAGMYNFEQFLCNYDHMVVDLF